MTESQGETQEQQDGNRRQAGSGVRALREELTPQITANKDAIEKVGEEVEETRKKTMEGFQKVDEVLAEISNKIDPNKSVVENLEGNRGKAVTLLKQLADADAKIRSEGYVDQVKGRVGDLGKFYDSRLNSWGQAIAAVGSGVATWLSASKILPFVNQTLNTLAAPLASTYGWSAISLSSPLWVVPIAFMAGSAGRFVYDKFADGFINYREKKLKEAVTAEEKISEVRAKMIEDLRLVAGGKVKGADGKPKEISELDVVGESELTEWLNKAEKTIQQMDNASVNDKGSYVFRKVSQISGTALGGLFGGASSGIPGAMLGITGGWTVGTMFSKPMERVISRIFPRPNVKNYDNPGNLAVT